MNHPDDTDRQWTDAQLQKVRIPSDLIHRLKTIGEDHTDLLDTALAAVPIPSGLLERTKTIANAIRLETRLQAVSIPDGLIHQLKQIPSTLALDAQLADTPVPDALTGRVKEIVANGAIDALLADIRVPDGFLGQVKESLVRERKVSGPIPISVLPADRIPERSCTGPPPVQARKQVCESPGIASDARGTRYSRRWSFAQWITAASLFLMLGSAHFMAFSVILISSLPPSPERTTDHFQLAADILIPPESQTTAEFGGEIQLLPSPPLFESLLAEMDSSPMPEIALHPPGDVPRSLGMNGTSAEMARDESILLAMPFPNRPNRSIERISPPKLRGIAPPPIREYDILAFARSGMHPFIAPNSHHLLRSITIPMVTDSDGFEAVKRELHSGKLPKPSSVRTEDFLAAMDYEFTPPTATPIQLRVAGGPSPWDMDRRQLLQIALQATESSRSPCVAERVRLTVSFHPDAVIRYRLLGHASDTAGGLLDGPLEVDLYAGQTATALIELELQPSRTTEIADIQVAWRDPETGMFQQAVQFARRAHFAPTFVEAAPSVQLAILAATTAEMLRNSPYMPDGFETDDIVRLADSVHPVLYDNPSLHELVDLLDAIQRLHN
ncbi:MAG: von Willebrand factor type A domain-containing protein [Pirellulales bacterium]|nr:von Willebrand factor type A domain-containing protein [Pirellulales bacterium]